MKWCAVCILPFLYIQTSTAIAPLKLPTYKRELLIYIFGITLPQLKWCAVFILPFLDLQTFTTITPFHQSMYIFKF